MPRLSRYSRIRCPAGWTRRAPSSRTGGSMTTGSPQSEAIQNRLAIPRQPIPKQSPADRIRNFEETYQSLDLGAAIVEAERCIDCPSAPCMDACPVSNDIPAALKLLERGEMEAAANKF